MEAPLVMEVSLPEPAALASRLAAEARGHPVAQRKLAQGRAALE